MSWIRRVLVHVGVIRAVPLAEAKAAKRADAVISRADRVLEDYKRQDAVLRLVPVRKR